jgi:hypothetical protein
MGPEKLKSLLYKYEAQSIASQLEEERYDKLLDYNLLTDRIAARAHLSWMCVEARKFVDAGRIEKAMRWLGFIQGCLWLLAYSTLNELKEDSRPATEAQSTLEADDSHIKKLSDIEPRKRNKDG